MENFCEITNVCGLALTMLLPQSCPAHAPPLRMQVTEEAYCWTVVKYTEGDLTIDFAPEDMSEDQLERFRKASILEKVQRMEGSQAFSICLNSTCCCRLACQIEFL